jgi:hypothetical protein
MSEADLLQPDTVIKERWKVVRFYLYDFREHRHSFMLNLDWR